MDKSLRKWWRRVFLMAVDVLLINLGFGLAYWIRYRLEWPWPVAPENDLPYQTYLPMQGVVTLLLPAVFWLHKIYVSQRGRGWLDEWFGLLNGLATGLMLVIVLTYFLPELSYSRGVLPLAAMTVLPLLTLSRIAERIILEQLRKRGIGVKRVLVVGAGEVGRTVIRTMVARPELGFRVTGFVDDDAAMGTTDLGPIKALGSVGNLPTLIQELNIDVVIITLPWMDQHKMMRVVRQCERYRVQMYIVPDMLQITIHQMGIELLGEVPMIGMRDEVIGHGWRIVKRAVDVVGALLALTLGAPLFLLVALLIRIDSPGPVIFKQIRLGEKGRPFVCWKFRTMCDDAEASKSNLIASTNGDKRLFKMKDDPRVTRVGRVLRRYRIDELPQFLNVLRGEMSIVGPRPPVPSEVAHYLDWHRRRLDVPTGITGLSQVSGGSDLSFDEWALIDIWYAENWTLLLDIKIMLKTVGVIIFGRGAY